MLVFGWLGHPGLSFQEFMDAAILPIMLFWWKFFPRLSKREADLLFKKAYAIVKSRPVMYEGADDVVRFLSAQGFKLMILSSYSEERLRAEAEAYGILDCFSKIVASAHYKWKAMGELTRHNGFNPRRTVFIGDMTHDVDTGRLAGVTTIASTYGYHSREKLQGSQPNYYIDHISQLIPIISAA